MNRRNRLRRIALVLALFVLAAIVTGVAESATKTAIPKQLARRWWGPSDGGPIEMRMDVGPRGRVEIDQLCSPDAPPACTPYYHHAEFSHVTAHRLTISGIPSCSGTGRYRWKTTLREFGGLGGHENTLRLTRIHDARKARIGLFVFTVDWIRGQKG